MFTLEQEIERLQLKNQPNSHSGGGGGSGMFDQINKLSSASSSSNKSGGNNRSDTSSPKPKAAAFNFENKIAQIGKLSIKNIDMSLQPNRSSTPDEKTQQIKKHSDHTVQLKQYQLRLEK